MPTLPFSHATLFAVALVFVAACAAGAGFRSERQAPGRADVREIAADTVSTGHEFGTTFSRDGHRLLFSRSDPSTRRVHILESVWVDGHWSIPIPLSFSNPAWSDLDPSITPDGRRLYFVSTRPHEGTRSSTTDMDIWRVDATANGWGDPQWERSLSSAATEGSPTTDRMGRICFFSDRDAPPGTNAIYCAAPRRGDFDPPARLNGNINAGPSDTSPFLSPDGTSLLFYSTRSGGAGSADLYFSHRLGDDWGRAINLGRLVNTEAPEYNPVVSPDGAFLVFGRNRRLYQVALASLGVDGLTPSRFR